jgi:GNAT superfamily N-acetyltransferase
MKYVVGLDSFDSMANFKALSLEHWESFNNPPPAFKEEFLKTLQLITAKTGNTTVGYLFFAVFNSPYHNERWCQTDMYYLSTKHRKQGVGKQMFDLLEETAKSQGCSKIMSSHNVKQSLDSFYKARGYVATHFVVAKEI